MIELAKLVPKKGATLKTWVEYREGIFLEINFISRADLQGMFSEFSYLKYDPAQKQRISAVKTEEFAKAFCVKAVTNWRGVTPKSFSAVLSPLDLNTLTKEQQTEEIPFTAENLQQAVSMAYEFDKFIQDSASDPKLYSPTHEDELGNSETSPSGSSTAQT